MQIIRVVINYLLLKFVFTIKFMKLNYQVTRIELGYKLLRRSFNCANSLIILSFIHYTIILSTTVLS